MEFRNRFLFGVLIVWFGLVLSGCEPSGTNDLDDTKEPHYVLGQSRVNAMDYQGAIEAFEESLEINPHSAQAHFQLAMLYDEKESDPAAAIYHYQQYLKFDPTADNADVIRQRIYSCKQQLAADVMPLPSAPAAQQQLQQLADKNRQLQEEVDKWRAYYESQMAAIKTNQTPMFANTVTQPAQSSILQAQTGFAQRSRNYFASPTKTTPRTHIVVAGETCASIARKFGVRLSALESANLGINPSRIRPGQILNIPPP